MHSPVVAGSYTATSEKTWIVNKETLFSKPIPDVFGKVTYVLLIKQ